MSDRTASVASVEAQSASVSPSVNPVVPPPESAPAPATVPAPESVEDTDAPESAEPRGDKLDALLTRAADSFGRASGTHAWHMCACGKASWEYIRERVKRVDADKRKDARAAAVAVLKGEFLRYSDSEPDVNRIVQTYHAVRVLSGAEKLPSPGAKDAPRVAWGKLTELAALVERNAEDESYALKADVKAEEAGKLYTDVLATAGSKTFISRDDVVSRVRAMLGKPEKPKDKPAPAAPASVPAPSPATVASIPNPAAAPVGAALVASVAPVAGKEQALPTASAAGVPFVSTLPPNAVVNPPKPADKPAPTVEEKADDPEETALSIVELVEDSERPDDVVEKVCDLLLTSKKLSNPTKRALQAALVVLKRNASPSPATVATVLNPAAVTSAPSAAVA